MPAPPDTLDEALDALWNSLGADGQAILRAAGHTFDAITAAAVEDEILLDAAEKVMRGLELVLDWLTGRFAQFVRAHDGIRRAWYVVDIMIAIVRGLIEDGVIIAEDFDVVNGIDFSEWLLSHGAQEESVRSALVRTIVYDLAFGYQGGDPQRPAAEAGTALRGLLRTFFTYRGSLMWKMNSGMGDTIFAPLYELLIKRGVSVEFFHRVEAVRAGGGHVQEIEIDLQADVPPGTTPASYLEAGTLPAVAAGAPEIPAVWPNAPLVLNNTAFAAVTAADYESWFAGRNAVSSLNHDVDPRCGERRLRYRRVRPPDQLRSADRVRPSHHRAALAGRGRCNRDRRHPGHAAVAQPAGHHAERRRAGDRRRWLLRAVRHLG